MKVITKGRQPDIKVVTPAIGTTGDRCDRSMVGECDLDSLLRRYSKEIAAWAPPVGDVVDTTILPSDPVDAINVSRDILGGISSINKTEGTKSEETKTKEAKPEEAKPEEAKENKDETNPDK